MRPHPFLTLPEVKKVAPISQLIESALSQNIPVIEEKDAMIGFGMCTVKHIPDCDLTLQPYRLPRAGAVSRPILECRTDGGFMER